MYKEQELFGKNLKFLRSRDKLSLQKVADFIGKTKAHIWDLEQGRSINPGLDIVLGVSTLFDVSVEYLLTDNENPIE